MSTMLAPAPESERRPDAFPVRSHFCVDGGGKRVCCTPISFFHLASAVATPSGAALLPATDVALWGGSFPSWRALPPPHLGHARRRQLAETLLLCGGGGRGGPRSWELQGDLQPVLVRHLRPRPRRLLPIPCPFHSPLNPCTKYQQSYRCRHARGVTECGAEMIGEAQYPERGCEKVDSPLQIGRGL